MTEAECANPLLLGWVSEWLETARERNSKGVTTYKKAYDSMKSCPLLFTHPSEAQQLTGFGPKLCSRLTDKLKEYCDTNGLPMPEIPQKRKKTAPKGNGDGDGAAEPVKKTRKPKPYVPALRSGGYAIILALATLDENSHSGITKQETIALAEPHCDSSFTAPTDPTKFYTAWGSMKTLVEKDLVYEKGRPSRKYALTEEGWEVAKRIKKANDGNTERVVTSAPKKNAAPELDDDQFISLDPSPSPPRMGTSESLSKQQAPDIIPQGEAIASTASLPAFTPIIIPPGSFDVKLVLDTREVRSTDDRGYMERELTKKGVAPIMRMTALGDVFWVAKMRDSALLQSLGAEGDEIVLDWIVERKRLDDLVSSIIGGRFHEQKFRLRKSGIKNIIYIIEEFSIDIPKYGEAVESAIASTQVVNGFFVKKTQKIDDTIRYLARMTRMLQGIYESKPLHLIPTDILTTRNYLPLMEHLRETQPMKDFHITHSAFSSLSSKSETLTLRDVYLKMLMCTKGVTGEKALEIQKRWKTPAEFVEAFGKCGGGEQGKKRKAEMVSNEMSNLMGRKKIAKALSVKIAEVWGEGQ
ncbi:Uncharacterized protein BP5553_02286 [Venustampulla echinocandica]|uniref:Crossover junction endonuclease MUS81 n=1 Tax=Venustampulla echinocandica TaxID=2656787 RepID=A0A370U3E7_9HELO|nr:Uncharacterized protein BP5553_02286 [Venustampulla echinocandica]RDL42307.1 Uncharacterized protein BP5553_02286 [Venustampulla echinocandica]